MRKVNLDEFLALPHGVIFRKVNPEWPGVTNEEIGEPCIKGESIRESKDFFYIPLFDNEDLGFIRDGCFFDAQEFLISDAADIDCVINRLRIAKTANIEATR